MQNYFNYFTEIEDHFQRRRGSLLLLSTLDWALIETWREAGIPLEAVLRGIDSAFDKYDARKPAARARRINGLAWCAQAVLTATEEMHEAATGISAATGNSKDQPPPSSSTGFEPERIADHLEACAAEIRASEISPSKLAQSGLAAIAAATAEDTAARLAALAIETRIAPRKLEDLERTLTVLEEKLFSSLIAAAPEDRLTALREQSSRELAPYRSRMHVTQLRQVEQQFLKKRLFEDLRLPRISLFHMPQS